MYVKGVQIYIHILYIYIYIYIHTYIWNWATITILTDNLDGETEFFIVMCSNEMSRMSKKNGLVTPLERRRIKLSNDVKCMDTSHTQPKLLDAELAWCRKFQMEKNTFDVHVHISTRSSTLSIKNWLFCFYYSINFDAFEINSQVMYVVKDISC